MERLFQIFILIFLLSSQIVFADEGQVALDKATDYYEKQNYKQAIKWLKKSYEIAPSSEVALNLGLAYKEIKDYSNSVHWLKKSYDLGESGGGYTLGNLYKKEGDIPNAIEWYKKAIDKGHVSAIKNLANLYKKQKDDATLGSAYMIGLINKGYTKEEVLGHLRGDWKIDGTTLKKAYQLQKTLIPNPYYDPEFEDKSVKRKSGRR